MTYDTSPFLGKVNFTCWLFPTVPVTHPSAALLVATNHGNSHELTGNNDNAETNKQAPGVVIVEDDLLFSPDFLEYLEVHAPVLERDTTTLVLSAWNDNGYRGRVRGEKEGGEKRTEIRDKCT